MTTMDFFLWEAARSPGCCILDRLPEDDHALFRPRIGRAMGRDYPNARDFPMSPDLGGVELPDLVRNTLGFYVVSKRLRETLERTSDASFEMLPIHILDRRGVRVSAPYWIANLLERSIPCADLQRSEMTEMAMKKGRYTSLKRLHLVPERIDPAFRILRLDEMPRIFLVRSDLRQDLEASGATGMRFWAMGDPVVID